jgi:tetratricopeptide (TPR) repeat protein
MGRAHYPEDAEILFIEGGALNESGDRRAAIACMERLIAGRDCEHFASVSTGLRGYKARHNLARYYVDEDCLAEAEGHLVAGLAEHPGFEPSLFLLGDVRLLRRDWVGVDEMVGRLRAIPRMSAEADVLRARGHGARQEFAAALTVLDAVLSSHPRCMSALVTRSHVLLQHGRDRAGAEQALRAVLAIDPNHAESRKNLDLLLREPVPARQQH